MMPRAKEHVVAVQITEILETTNWGVKVRIKRTGLPAWLPRRYTDFMPGRAVIPKRLADKILSGASGETSGADLKGD